MAYWRRFYTDLQGHSEVVCYSAIDLVGTKDLKKGLAGRASKSKSKSSKNGLKSGLESKSGLEYYKSDNWPLVCVSVLSISGSVNLLLLQVMMMMMMIRLLMTLLLFAWSSRYHEC